MLYTQVALGCTIESLSDSLLIRSCNLLNIRYAESPVKEKETDNTGRLAESVAEPLQKDAEECLLISESEASKKDASSGTVSFSFYYLLPSNLQ